MKAFQRILAVLLCLVMSLGMISMVASAESIFDSNKNTGSLTINKLEKGENAEEPDDSTGLESTTLPSGYTALGEVTFTVYQVLTQAQFESYLANTLTKKVNGVDQIVTELKVDDFYNATTKAVTNFSGESVTGESKITPSTTDMSNNEVAGQVVFSNLSLGVYLVVESSYPTKVTEPMTPFLVSIPMTDPINNNEWIYDVTVYPKNKTSEGKVTIQKYNEDGSGLDGVTFALKQKNADGAYVAVTGELADYASVVTANGGKIEYTLTPGDYSVEETAAPMGYIVDQRPIYFTVTSENTITETDGKTNPSAATINLGSLAEEGKAVTFTLTNEKPDVDKTLADGKEDANAAIGSTVSYKVTVDVPENITDLKTFTLTDTPTNLKDQVSTIKVNGSTDNDSDMFAAEGNDNGFIITFDTSKMESVAGTTITVTYDAVVLAAAASDGKAPNTIDLTYSNKIHPNSSTQDGEGDKNHIEDKAIVYTYKIDVTKYKDSVADGNELGNVMFELYKGSDTTPLSVVKDSDGNYRLAVSTDAAADKTTTLVTASNGKLVITGLDSDTYYLKETKTVDGYNLLSDKVAVDLNLDTVTKWTESKNFVKNSKGGWDLVKETYESTTYSAGETTVSGNFVTKTIVNKKGFELPQTGGIGTLMFIIIGGVLMAGGICLIVPNKKRAV